MILASKKFQASLAWAIVVLINHYFGLEIPEDTIVQVLALLWTYIVWQGIADHGKEKAKIESNK